MSSGPSCSVRWPSSSGATLSSRVTSSRTCRAFTGRPSASRAGLSRMSGREPSALPPGITPSRSGCLMADRSSSSADSGPSGMTERAGLATLMCAPARAAAPPSRPGSWSPRLAGRSYSRGSATGTMEISFRLWRAALSTATRATASLDGESDWYVALIASRRAGLAGWLGGFGQVAYGALDGRPVMAPAFYAFGGRCGVRVLDLDGHRQARAGTLGHAVVLEGPGATVETPSVAPAWRSSRARCRNRSVPVWFSVDASPRA